MKVTTDQMKLVANTIRCLCADMVEKANSGHPGAAMGMADLASVLWLNHLRVDPQDVTWAKRDRLVFSGGHASALVYALFHFAGVGGLTMDELKTFRQWGSRCAGHPERGLMPGVEVTTGPLGQGIAMGIGLTLAAKKAKTGNRTWVFCGDGDLEEGISHEVCSWAGAMKLDDLILVYDSNHITIEGDTSLALNDNTKLRFQSYGWKVFEVDGHDPEAIHRVYQRAEKVTGQPVLIIATTHIGYGAPTKQDTADCHGAPLGAEEVKGLKVALGFNPEESFVVSQKVYDIFKSRTQLVHGRALRWKKLGWKKPIGDMADPEAIKAALPTFPADKPVATRAACGTVMNAIAPLVPGLIGGSADLGPSNKTVLKGLGDVGPGDFSGRNIHFGIRELGMSAIINGMTAFDDTIRGFGATGGLKHEYYGIRDGDEELAVLYHLLGRKLVGKRAEDIIAAAKFAGGRVKLVAKGRAAIPAAHAYYTARELFSGIELVDPPPSWAEYLADDGRAGRFADIVRGAWAHYDWTDLVTATVIHTGDSY